MNDRLNFDDFSMGLAQYVRNAYLLSNGMIIAFMRGSFNLWAAAVYKFGLVDPVTKQLKVALPKDEYYFGLLLEVLNSGRIAFNLMWDAVRWVYNASGLEADSDFCRSITYYVYTSFPGCPRYLLDKFHDALLHIYYGFIAENYYRGERVSEGPIRTKFGAAIKFNALWTLFETRNLTLAVKGPNGNGWDGATVKADIVRRGIRQPEAITKLGIKIFDEYGVSLQQGFQHMYDMEARVRAGEDSFRKKGGYVAG